MNEMIDIDVIKGPEKGKRIRVPAGGFTVGRSPDPAEVTCALVGDLSVSRRHAVGRVQGDKVVLEEWPGHPSKAGIRVGEKRVASVTVGMNEPVVLGRTTLVFRRPGQRHGWPARLSPAWRRRLVIAAAVAALAVAVGAWSGPRKQMPEPAPVPPPAPDARRVEKRFEAPLRLEESLRLDDARDAWLKVALELEPGDPLRVWVETGCVARLNRRIAELRP